MIQLTEQTYYIKRKKILSVSKIPKYQTCISKHYTPERPQKYRQKCFTGKLIFKKILQSKNIDFIDNGKLKEEHLDQKMLYLNENGNSIFANTFKKYLKLKF